MQGWLQLDTSNPLRYRKEVLPLGKFAKLDAKGNGIQFQITPEFQKHLVLSVQEQRKNGIGIPYSKTHKDWSLASNKYGDVVDSVIQPNSKGVDTFCVDVDFANIKDRDEAIKADSSVGIPDVFFDGTGREWKYPLKHVAATSAPVIPGLAPFQSIAASFFDVPSNLVIKATDMYENLIKSLELSAEETTAFNALDEAGKTTAIETAVAKLKEGLTLSQSELTETKTKLAAATKTPGKSVTETPSPMMVNVISENRGLKLSHLVETGKLDLPTMKALEKLHATNDTVALELSNGSDGSTFDNLVEILSKNNPLAPTGRHIDLAHEDSKDTPQSNGLIANAEARAKAAAGK